MCRPKLLWMNLLIFKLSEWIRLKFNLNQSYIFIISIPINATYVYVITNYYCTSTPQGGTLYALHIEMIDELYVLLRGKLIQHKFCYTIKSLKIPHVNIISWNFRCRRSNYFAFSCQLYVSRVIRYADNFFSTPQITRLNYIQFSYIFVLTIFSWAHPRWLSTLKNNYSSATDHGEYFSWTANIIATT